MERFVECVMQVYGFHNWEKAPAKVDYLANKHRHVFGIKAGFFVCGNDRVIEINLTQNEILKYLFQKYGIEGTPECDFGGMSCEAIAQDILETFSARFVEVTEDGYGGALLVR